LNNQPQRQEIEIVNSNLFQ